MVWKVRGSNSGRSETFFSFRKLPRLALGYTQPPLQWKCVCFSGKMRPTCNADHSFPSNTRERYPFILGLKHSKESSGRLIRWRHKSPQHRQMFTNRHDLTSPCNQLLLVPLRESQMFHFSLYLLI